MCLLHCYNDNLCLIVRLKRLVWFDVKQQSYILMAHIQKRRRHTKMSGSRRHSKRSSRRHSRKSKRGYNATQCLPCIWSMAAKALVLLPLPHYVAGKLFKSPLPQSSQASYLP